MARMGTRAPSPLGSYPGPAGASLAGPPGSSMPDPRALLAAHDRQLRGQVSVRLPPGVVVEEDGPLQRFAGWSPRGLVLYRDLGGLGAAELDRLVRRQQQYFGAQGQAFEWKTYGHDQPRDLPGRLLALGFVPEPVEHVLIGLVEEQALPVRLPPGARLREATERSDAARLAALLSQIWGEDLSFLAEQFWADRQANPGEVLLIVVEAEGEVIACARINLVPGTEFATLWSGATRADWRGRGVYRAMVAHRAGLARERGLRYLQVDASAQSRPILERLGFVTVTSTTPYVWTPPGGEAQST